MKSTFGELGNSGSVHPLPDAMLLGRFVRRRDTEAFRQLVLRHGGLVAGVCQSVLSNEHDAEDAVQATFLLLAENAGRVRNAASVSSWLYGTAYRISLKARTRRGRRREQPLLEPLQQDDAQLEQVAKQHRTALLLDELRRLPEKYRAPLVICYLQGRSREDAAAELDCSLGAVKGRLERGRCELRRRLLARGALIQGGTMLAITLAAPLSATDAFVDSTVDAAVAYANGGAVSTNLSDNAVQLAKGGSVMRPSGSTLAAANLTAAAVVAMCFLLASQAGVADDRSVRRIVVERPRLQSELLGNNFFAVELDGTLATSLLEPAETETESSDGGDGLRTVALEGPLTVVEWSRDGKRMAVLKRRLEKRSENGQTRVIRHHTVRIHDAKTGAEITSLGELPNDGLMAFCFSPDGTRLAVSKRVRTPNTHDIVELYDAASGELVKTIEFDYGRGKLSIEFSPDGGALAVAYGGPPTRVVGGARLFDAATGELRRAIVGHKHIAASVAFSPNGKLLATGGNQHDREVRIWNVANGQLIRICKGFDGAALGLAFSPDNKRLAAADRGSGVRLWDVGEGKQIELIQDNPPDASRVVFSRDGRRLACGRLYRLNGAWKFEVRLWDAQSGKLLFKAPSGSDSVSISADNREISYLNPDGNGVVIKRVEE